MYILCLCLYVIGMKYTSDNILRAVCLISTDPYKEFNSTDLSS